MPTVLTLRNIRIVVYPNDHPPAHVHAIRPSGGRATFELNCPEGPVRLAQSLGFSRAEVNEIGAVIAMDLVRACNQWSRFHGQV